LKLLSSTLMIEPRTSHVPQSAESAQSSVLGVLKEPFLI
jgi:hypothetical protein